MPRAAIADPPAGAPTADRAPDDLAAGTPPALRARLEALLGPEHVLSRATDLVRYASDGSPYRRFPQAVVAPQTVEHVRALLAHARQTGIPLTWRAAGTSLNGQAQGDGVLVDVRRGWQGVQVLDDQGIRVRVRPGTALGAVNRRLARYGRRLGPDPASAQVATAGGVIANNSGGMRCGVVADSYSTLRELVFVLPSGTVVDTAAPDAEERFAAQEPQIAAGLLAIRDELRADAELCARIRSKFAIKNTTGYRLCAFLDAHGPVRILQRLLVGSEGTLGFIAEAELETVPLPARTAVSWVHFPSIDAAIEPVTALVAAGATAVELMVAPALMVASHSIAGTPEHWRELPLDSAVLLVEFGAEDDDALDVAVARGEEVLAGHELIRPTAFTRDRHEVEIAWTVREGMFGLVGKLRAPGTSLITEDVCVAPDRLAPFARDMQELLGRHGFLTGVAGHASAGNLHFMLTPDMNDPAGRETYEAFIAEMVDLVIDGYDGSLKAEHGTGVNMAPYVEREWGPRATALMWRVKELVDPHGILAPGVILNSDPGVHVRDLKSQPLIEEAVAGCVECGFCEPVCPSRDLTLTPRQRIVLRREMARQPAGGAVRRALEEDFAYEGLDTCAADGVCAIACPLGIDTGALVKGLRAQATSDRADRLAAAAARDWARVEAGARAGLRAGAAAGPGAMAAVTTAARRVAPPGLVPAWPAAMPAPAPARLPATPLEGAVAVYLPACVNRIFGGPDGGPTLPQALVAVSARAGRPVWIPPDAAGHCCATPWSSKGHTDGHALMADRTAQALERWSDGGRLPVVVDASSCTLGILEDVVERIPPERRPQVVDAVAWARDELLPSLTVTSRAARVAVHPTCATRHLGLADALADLAGALAEEVDVPASASCCGMAGDRGLLHPELPASALAPEVAELAAHAHDAFVSSNRTCEIGLEQATGEAFASIVLLLEERTRP